MDVIVGWLIFLLAAGELGFLILAFVQAWYADQRSQKLEEAFADLLWIRVRGLPEATAEGAVGRLENEEEVPDAE